ncbi:MAG: hypothetical protein AAGH88_11750 [Planctomycetota bacterium]
MKIDELDKTPLGSRLSPAKAIALGAVGVGGLLLITGFFGGRSTLLGGGLERIMFAYLIAYAFFLALTVGSLALVVLTTLFRAGWVVAVRRVPETFAANFLFMGILALPIIFVALFGNGMLYPWSKDMEQFGEEVHQAEEFLHDLHGGHDDHAADTPNSIAGQEEDEDGYHNAVFVADTDPHARDGHGGDEHADHGHAHDHSNQHPAPGMAYPDDPELALKIQQANYTTLLAYMLDYKRYGGMLLGKEQIAEGKGWLWFHPMAFLARMVIYLAVFTLMGLFYWKKSVAQDASADAGLTTQREWWAPASTIGFALTVTFCSFDLLMSLDPAWYSTMFGVIFFANSFLTGIAVTILVCMLLQKQGLLKVVNVEHYHDLGKLLFAMTFFWGYVSFSQFMLIWYASLPETTYWFEIRGGTTVSTAPQYGSAWSWMILLLLFGHLLIPFGFLLSRHVKRNMTCLAIACVWMLVMVYLDLFWYVMPVYESPGFTLGLPELGAVLLVGGAVVWRFLKRFGENAPVAHNDPRISETTALDTNVWAPIYH